MCVAKTGEKQEWVLKGLRLKTHVNVIYGGCSVHQKEYSQITARKILE